MSMKTRRRIVQKILCVNATLASLRFILPTPCDLNMICLSGVSIQEVFSDYSFRLYPLLSATLLCLHQ